MNANEDILDDMDGLKDPPPPKEKKEANEGLSKVLGFILVVVGLFVFGIMNGSSSRTRKIDMDRINRMIEPTLETTKRMEGMRLNLESIEKLQRAEEDLKKILDSIKMHYIKPSQAELEKFDTAK